MLVFVDTEFTDFSHPELISIALVSEDGREFYAERSDFSREDCSDFVREQVLPQLGKFPEAICTAEDLTIRLRQWFDELPEPATIMVDFFTDQMLLVRALLGASHQHSPKNLGEIKLIGNEVLEDPGYQEIGSISYGTLSPHHALGDARSAHAAYVVIKNRKKL